MAVSTSTARAITSGAVPSVQSPALITTTWGLAAAIVS